MYFNTHFSIFTPSFHYNILVLLAFKMPCNSPTLLSLLSGPISPQGTDIDV